MQLASLGVSSTHAWMNLEWHGHISLGAHWENSSCTVADGRMVPAGSASNAMSSSSRGQHQEACALCCTGLRHVWAGAC